MLNATIATNLTRALILVSWGLFLLILIASLPIPEEGALRWTFSLLIAMIGTTGGVLAVLAHPWWFTTTIVPAVAIVALFLARVIAIVHTKVSTWKMGLLDAITSVFNDSWKIFDHLLNEKGVLPATSYVYDWVVMPSIQIAILLILYRTSRSRGPK